MVSCEDLFTESSSTSLSHESTLRSLKRSQLARSKSGGGFFYNPFRNEREKMDQLSELLNHYSQVGIPEQSALLACGRKQHDLDEALFLEDHWRVIVTNADELDRRMQNQQDAIWELLHTEAFYIKRLRVVTDLFLACLCNLQTESLLNDVSLSLLHS